MKAAFTRAYNKEAPALPYAAPGAGAVKTKRGAGALNDADDPYNEYDAEADEDADDPEQDDITNDAMIKVCVTYKRIRNKLMYHLFLQQTKKASSKAATSTNKAPSTSKGKTAAKPKTSKRGTKK